MEKQELIAKIQLLKAIKPGKDWVLETKAQLFESQPSLSEAEPQAVGERLRSRISWQRLFSFPSIQLRPALALYTLLLLVIIGGFVFWNLSPSLSPSIPQNVSEKNDANTQKILTSLVELQANLEKAAKGLDALKENSQSPNEALVTTGAIKYTAKNIKEVTESLIKAKEKEIAQKKSLNPKGKKDQILASLIETKNRSQDLEKRSERKEIEITKFLIDDLKTRTLTKESQGRLQKAITAYNEGRYEEAMVLAMRIYNERSYSD